MGITDITELQKRFITVRDGGGKIYNYSIKQFIPMQKHQSSGCLKVEDVEILLVFHFVHKRDSRFFRRQQGKKGFFLFHCRLPIRRIVLAGKDYC